MTVLTVKFQVINNNTTRLLDCWQPMAGLVEQTHKYKYRNSLNIDVDQT